MNSSFFFFEATLISAQGLLQTLCSWIISDKVWGTIFGSRNQYQAGIVPCLLTAVYFQLTI